ncbi:MAG: hypothetical protein HQL29_03195 [Candidatus Omnitrophica bacterium]|nr:hypothetical protein [Candidatus Omnitrophota bacterium]
MNNTTKTVVTTSFNTIGIILILMSAFDIMPKYDNVLIFVGISIIIVGNAINKIAK